MYFKHFSKSLVYRAGIHGGWLQNTSCAALIQEQQVSKVLGICVCIHCMHVCLGHQLLQQYNRHRTSIHALQKFWLELISRSSDCCCVVHQRQLGFLRLSRKHTRVLDTLYSCMHRCSCALCVLLLAQAITAWLLNIHALCRH